MGFGDFAGDIQAQAEAAAPVAALGEGAEHLLDAPFGQAAAVVLHVDHGGARWVGLVHGVHTLPIGSDLGIWLDPANLYLFDSAGRLAATGAPARG